MAETIVNFEFDGVQHPLQIDGGAPSTTVDLFLNTLPEIVDLHCAKVAGNQFYWHAPFMVGYEEAGDVTRVPAGSVVFWPERQLVEVIYGELHPEAGSINSIGKFVGDLKWLTELGALNVRRQGRDPVFARLSTDAPVAAFDLPPPPPALESLRAARLEAWKAQPEEFNALMRRRGLMLPFGPLMFADSELRKIHEVISRLWLRPQMVGRKDIALFSISLGADRLNDLCGLHQTAAILRDAAAVMAADSAPLDEVLHELALYTSRLAAWLDLNICWFDLTEEMVGSS